MPGKRWPKRIEPLPVSFELLRGNNLAAETGANKMTFCACWAGEYSFKELAR